MPLYYPLIRPNFYTLEIQNMSRIIMHLLSYLCCVKFFQTMSATRMCLLFYLSIINKTCTNQICQVPSLSSLHSSLFCFLLAGESESQGEVAQMHGARVKRGTAGRGKEKPAPEPLHFTKRRLWTNGRQLGITIGQSHINQNDQCQQLLNRFSGMIRSDQL